MALADLDLIKTYIAVPRTSLATFVVGQTVNSLALPLLPGDARLYVGADLVGSSALEFVAPRESTELYLGKDESIKITRDLDSKNSDRTFFGNRKRMEVAYTITATNFHDHPIDLAIEEALPVSQDERIRIKVQNLNPKPADQDRGITRWNLRLEKGESKPVTFRL